MLPPGFNKGLIGSLYDALRADIYPTAGSHLSIHHQIVLIQLVKVLPIRPVRYQVGIGN